MTYWCKNLHNVRELYLEHWWETLHDKTGEKPYMPAITDENMYMTYWWETVHGTWELHGTLVRNCTWHTGEKPYMTRLVRNLTWHAINTWNSVEKLYNTYWWETLHAMLQLHGTLVRNFIWHTGKKPYMTRDNCTWNTGEINIMLNFLCFFVLFNAVKTDIY